MTIDLEPLPAPIDGINQKDDPEHIADTEALWLQDAILDTPGRIRRRGPLTDVGWDSGNANSPVSAQVSVSGAETEYVCLLCQKTIGNGVAVGLAVNVPGFGSSNDILLTAEGSSAFPAIYGWQSVDKNGRILNTWTSKLDVHAGASEAAHTNAFWYSGSSTNAVTPSGTPVVGSGKGTTAVTGGSAFDSELVPGTYLYNKVSSVQAFIGVIKSIESASALTLEKGAQAVHGGTGNMIGYATKPFMLKHGKGRITTNTTSDIVQGVGTKFLGAIGSVYADTEWELYRRSDGVLIGAVESSGIKSNVKLVLTGNAAIGMVNEEYIAVPSLKDAAVGMLSVDVATQVMPGVVTTPWRGRFWYMNSPNVERLQLFNDYDLTSRVMFSSLDDPEDLDWSQDGDWFDLASNIAGNDPILAAQGTDRALLIFKREEVVAVTGRTPSEFTPDVVLNDGLLHPSAVAPYKEGCVWAGKNDVYYFNGETIEGLVKKQLGDSWSKLVQNIVASDANVHYDKAAVVVVERDHAFIYLDNADPERDVVKVASAENLNQLTLVVNLLTGAISTWKNAAFRDSFSFNTSTGRKSYVVGYDTANGVAGGDPLVIDIDAAFTGTGAEDSDFMEGMAKGPDFYWETKRWSGPSEFLKKRVKRLRQQFLSVTQGITAEVVTGKDRGNITGVAIGTLAASSTFTHQDILLSTTLDEWIGFRFYEVSGVTNASLGESLLFFKTQRMTRT